MDDSIQCTSYFHQVLSTQYGNKMILTETIVDRDKDSPNGEILRQGSQDGSLQDSHGRDIDTSQVGGNGDSRNNIDYFEVSIPAHSSRLDKFGSLAPSFIEHGAKSLHSKDTNVCISR